MEIILALVVVIAVIIFGALISLGNERQRKAIEELREQIVLWAKQDLYIKRDTFAHEIRIDDPLAWLNKITTNIVGSNLQLQSIEFLDSPMALVCTINNRASKAVFSFIPPTDIRNLKKKQTSWLSRYSQDNPLFSVSRTTRIYEITVLNAGPIFDLELQVAWKHITGQSIDQVNGLWLYLLE